MNKQTAFFFLFLVLTFFLNISILSAQGSKAQPPKSQKGLPPQKGKLPPDPLKQRFKCTVGGTCMSYTYNKSNELVFGVNISPQVNLIRWGTSDFSLSVCTQAMVGYHPATGSDSLAYIASGFPVLFDLNIGHLATKEFYRPWGVVLGVGYDMGILHRFQNGFITSSGIRFWLLGQSLTLRYTHSFIFSPGYDTNGLSLNVTLGKWVHEIGKGNKQLEWQYRKR